MAIGAASRACRGLTITERRTMALVSDFVFSLLVVASGLFAASTLGFAVAWLRARERAIRAEQRLAPPLTGDARVERLERAMESIAVEVEQMAEGQRFVSRLLGERGKDGREAGAQAAGVTSR